MKILQVVGFKKSGKTTTMNTIIQQIKSKGYKVAVIKHHGDQRGREIDIPKSRDHITYIESGADESIVQGYQYMHKLILQEDISALDNLEHIISNEVTTNPDIILIEGYKQANYDKIIVFNNAKDKQLLNQLTNISLSLDTSLNKTESDQILEIFINKWVDDTRETI
ncbi:molybdopterin-guanine dinucleotide biosynthesis protein B [Macrococcoides caseolyticum]|uniref:molybdopterin-guanine dinucleotide biosynthesis protein B n=1 Tax=Macrococcoides caseolyticum TaxID=69966 RepID=UPI001F2F56FC|nr:molybdopterin-guanine dinucleotide biosynthesis protein B [Macrococcus caseolyticus]MCE4956486.1 molybdopterin-guanine dinucleotide biosynthesis protein B [Macrococcus caseolyticus]